ncbi:MAG TPA: hypothetical protein VEX60_00950, partial [Pyrinomonadaceae bacterium]|nr:hypothetical protein [Pyrinomonadaceae bacterium]
MKKIRQIILHAAMLCAVVAVSTARAQEGSSAQPAQTPGAAVEQRPRGPQSVVKDGIKVEFDIEPLAAGDKTSVMAGEEARVRFRLSDAAKGTPLTGVRPAAWMSLRETPGPADAAQCREKIQS